MLKLALLLILTSVCLLSIYHLGSRHSLSSALGEFDQYYSPAARSGSGLKKSEVARWAAAAPGASAREDYCANTDLLVGSDEVALAGATGLDSLRGKPGAVAVLEHGIHDEVVGAVAHTLQRAGIEVELNYFARFSFPDILDQISPGLTITNPHIKENLAALEEGIKGGRVQVLVLTTCSGSLPNLMPLILSSPQVHVVCLIHHSGPDLYHKMRQHLEPLAKEERITLVVLGDHVRREIALDLQEWAERDEAVWWERLPLETLLPIFDYPGDVARIDPGVFPSRAAIQGNIETGRRNYAKILSDLKTSIVADPTAWGYRKVAEGAPYTAMTETGASPFTLHLVGQKPAGSTIEIPVELEEVVSIHQKLAYPGYYDLLSSMDVIIPAFAQASTYVETTSSSIAASAIVRVPVLASSRHVQAYNYLDSPCIVPRNISESEISAIARVRKQPAALHRRRPSSEWETFQDNMLKQNVCMWRKVLSAVPVKQHKL